MSIDKEKYVEYLTDVIDKLKADWDWGYGLYDGYGDPKEHQNTPELIKALEELRDIVEYELSW